MVFKNWKCTSCFHVKLVGSSVWLCFDPTARWLWTWCGFLLPTLNKGPVRAALQALMRMFGIKRHVSTLLTFRRTRSWGAVGVRRQSHELQTKTGSNIHQLLEQEVWELMIPEHFEQMSSHVRWEIWGNTGFSYIKVREPVDLQFPLMEPLKMWSAMERNQKGGGHFDIQ